jgi:hypothetical protein
MQTNKQHKEKSSKWKVNGKHNVNISRESKWVNCDEET